MTATPDRFRAAPGWTVSAVGTFDDEYVGLASAQLALVARVRLSRGAPAKDRPTVLTLESWTAAPPRGPLVDMTDNPQLVLRGWRSVVLPGRTVVLSVLGWSPGELLEPLADDFATLLEALGPYKRNCGQRHWGADNRLLARDHSLLERRPWESPT